MKSLLDQKNLGELREVVHRLKGAGGCYGFHRVSKSAGIAEHSFHTGAAIEAIESQVNGWISLIERVQGYSRQPEVATES